MGLMIASDLDEWHRWQQRRHQLRHVKHRLTRSERAPDSHATVFHGSPDADIVVLVDATHASMASAVLAPLRFIPPQRVITVLGPGARLDMTGSGQRVPVTEIGRHLRSARALLGCGEYTGIGATGWRWARESGAATFVSQHGALAPHAPPLPRGSTLLAWSAADGDYWRSGRSDVRVRDVGSQLLWAAAERQSRPPDTGTAGAQLIYLGQGHAAEMPRRRLVESALKFCRENNAAYRPHPAEKDRVSLTILAAYRRAGVTVDRTSVPLAHLTNPVVSVFSTGILEAAARGQDAWVDFPRPPAWLEQFWERYAMSRFGSTPTPAPERPDVEPARRIAEIVTEAAR